MELGDFYHRLLKLDAVWEVKNVVIDNELEQVEVHIEYRTNGRVPCQSCGGPSRVSGFGETRKWRHLDTFRTATYLFAAMPVVDCPKHGKQMLPAPWARESSPCTSALERWCILLAKEFGGVKVASRITGVSAGDIRSMLRKEKERYEAITDAASEAFTESPNRGERQPQVRQLSLFAQKDMPLINEGIQALKRLDLDSAVKNFQKHKRLFPRGYDVASKISIAEFLREGLQSAPTEGRVRLLHLCNLWRSLEDHLVSIGAAREPSLPSIRETYFEKALQEAENSALIEMPFVSDNIPMGYLHLQAGRLENAIQSLQACILKDPHNAAVYGYLGDAYLLRGDIRTARQSYREACFIDPAGIDWEHLRDRELKELAEELLLEYGFDRQLTLQWLPSHARINGLFERKIIRLHEGVKEMVSEYLALRKSLARKQSPLMRAKLFLRGSVLCENEENFKLVKKIELIDVRREMRQANPDLFEEFLEKIIAQKGD